MKLTKSNLQKIIKEEVRAVLADLDEKKKKGPTRSQEKKVASKQNKRTAKHASEFVKAPEHFSPRSTPKEAAGTIHNCAKHVTDQDREKKGESTEKDMTKKEQDKGYAICNQTGVHKGITGKKTTGYKKGSECARVGGKTPENC